MIRLGSQEALEISDARSQRTMLESLRLARLNLGLIGHAESAFQNCEDMVFHREEAAFALESLVEVAALNSLMGDTSEAVASSYNQQRPSSRRKLLKLSDGAAELLQECRSEPDFDVSPLMTQYTGLIEELQIRRMIPRRPDRY